MKAEAVATGCRLGIERRGLCLSLGRGGEVSPCHGKRFRKSEIETTLVLKEIGLPDKAIAAECGIEIPPGTLDQIDWLEVHVHLAGGGPIRPGRGFAG